MGMKRLGRIVGLAALLAWSMPHLVHAQLAGCNEDIQKFCKDVKPGEGRIIACLKQHEAELSEGCKHASQTKHGHMPWAGPGAACKGDVQKFCKDVQPGGGRIIKCLEDHKAELSPECAAQEKTAHAAPTPAQ
jgi:hypothetical protein